MAEGAATQGGAGYALDVGMVSRSSWRKIIADKKAMGMPGRRTAQEVQYRHRTQ
jgi:hypothetical protein